MATFSTNEGNAIASPTDVPNPSMQLVGSFRWNSHDQWPIKFFSKISPQQIFIQASTCGDTSKTEIGFVAGATNNQDTNPVGHWPWIASLGLFDDSNQWEHKCGATLISDRHFLTAAHCVHEG